MKNIIRFLCLLLLATPLTLQGQKRPTRVACVGNSITYGANIVNREANSYPAQLQAFLGPDFEVRNFGVSATTLLSQGDYPYTSTQAYADSRTFEPDIVLIKLGTNDTKPQNWKFHGQFMAEYQRLIDSYRTLPSHPRVILLTPVRCFLPETGSISASLIREAVRPMVEKLAFQNGLEIINLHNLFGDVWQAHIMPDHLHPSSIGAGDMAQKIGTYLLQETVKPTPLKIEGAVEKDFHGFKSYHFTYKGTACQIVQPYIEATGKPWVLRARFWGHEPQTDIELLEHGFHIAYCDVSDLYGAPQAVKRWNRFYQYLISMGFSKKAVLEGMSRGGLPAYAWAAANPGKVACIYADAPVMDFKSWPMGKGKGERSEEDVKKLLAAYGFDSEDEALRWRRQPLDLARHMAKACIPILHVVGDADTVVPVEENTSSFEHEMELLGAPITVIHKAGVGHHPHSLNNPQPIVHFILSATRRYHNPCTHAIPGNEYRSGAGWSEGADWHAAAADIRQALQAYQAPSNKLRLLLVGNSITQGWGGNRKTVTWKPGKNAMDSIIGKGYWETAGISGDRTQNLLWRIEQDYYSDSHPGHVVIAIGVNNLLAGDSPAEVADGIVAVTKACERTFPQAQIELLGLFPAGKEPQSTLRQSYNEIQDLLKKRVFTRTRYTDPTSWLTDNTGRLTDGLYSDDGVHLTEAGYRVVAGHIAKLMR